MPKAECCPEPELVPKQQSVRLMLASEERGDEVMGQRAETEDWEIDAAPSLMPLPTDECREVFALFPFHQIAIPHQGKSCDSEGASVQPF